MTVIVGVEHSGSVTIGADSLAATPDIMVTRADPKVFRVGSYLIGSAGSPRATQLLQHALRPPRPDERNLHAFMCTEFIDAVREAFAEGGQLNVDSNVQATANNFLVGVCGHLFGVESDFQVGRLTYGYNAVGTGEPFALGSLHTTARMGLTPRKRIQLALEAAAEHNPFVRGPFNLLTLKP